MKDKEYLGRVVIGIDNFNNVVSHIDFKALNILQLSAVYTEMELLQNQILKLIDKEHNYT
jgi:hypothetical protein